MPTFGARFKELRLSLKMTQDELAQAINEKYNLTFGKSAVSQYENDKRTPEIYALEKFAFFFDVSVDYLLGNSNIKKLEQPQNSDFHSISTEGLDEKDIEIVQAMIDRLRNIKK